MSPDESKTGSTSNTGVDTYADAIEIGRAHV